MRSSLHCKATHSVNARALHVLGVQSTTEQSASLLDDFRPRCSEHLGTFIILFLLENTAKASVRMPTTQAAMIGSIGTTGTLSVGKANAGEQPTSHCCVSDMNHACALCTYHPFHELLQA